MMMMIALLCVQNFGKYLSEWLTDWLFIGPEDPMLFIFSFFLFFLQKCMSLCNLYFGPTSRLTTYLACLTGFLMRRHFSKQTGKIYIYRNIQRSCMIGQNQLAKKRFRVSSASLLSLSLWQNDSLKVIRPATAGWLAGQLL